MHTLLTVVLAALPCFVALPAQQFTGGPDPDRKSLTVAVQVDGSPALAAVSIAYSPPVWRDSHDDVLVHLEASNYTRLGKDWWATLDTIGALEIGGTRVEAGSYYLGMHIDQRGAFSLLLFDSGQAMRKRLLPSSTSLYTGADKANLVVPLTFAKNARKDVVAKLEIEITADRKDPAKGTLALRWGRHEATAPVTFDLRAGKSEAGGKQ